VREGEKEKEKEKEEEVVLAMGLTSIKRRPEESHLSASTRKLWCQVSSSLSSSILAMCVLDD
jgi:hypothetical protein